MTKAEAKKIVARATSKMIDPRCGHDFEWYGDIESEKTRALVRAAAIELADELSRRGAVSVQK